MSELRVDRAPAPHFTGRMRKFFVFFALLCAVAPSGCLWKKSAPQYTETTPAPARAPVAATPAPITPAYSNHNVILTPENALVGKVASVNPGGRFVVLNFPVGHLPQNDQSLQLYRQGAKVAEVKITGPQQDDNIVADIV